MLCGDGFIRKKSVAAAKSGKSNQVHNVNIMYFWLKQSLDNRILFEEFNSVLYFKLKAYGKHFKINARAG